MKSKPNCADHKEEEAYGRKQFGRLKRGYAERKATPFTRSRFNFIQPGFILMIMTVLTLAGCATTPTHKTTHYLPTATDTSGINHIVKSGETLWGISRMYGVGLNTLLKVNRLGESASIEKGQVIIIPVKEGRRNYQGPAYVSNESFAWPLKGDTMAYYGSKINNVINKGIDIRVPEGTNVAAARSGRVVYCDSHLKGFGKTVIIDHGDRLQTVYSYNSDILVNVGDNVSKHDIIARAGKTGRAKEASLHFEIRKDGEPQNPLYYLPR